MIIKTCNRWKAEFTNHGERVDERKKTVVENFRPYFYMKSSDNQPKYYNPSKFIKREFTYEEGRLALIFKVKN